MASLSVRSVVKMFGELQVLKSISLEVEEGEFTVLVGPSGCGKSTLLRMLAGLDEVSSGEIWIGSTMVNDLSPMERDIAMVFQSYALYPHMTVAENMSFNLRLKKVPAREIAEKVKKASEILGLQDLLDRRPKQLSGGQRQRVAMGRCIVRDPAVFLFDEPLSNLDAKLRVKMRAEIKELHQRLKTTTIYVTHDQIEALTMADKIVVMRSGNVEQIGKPLDLYDRPVNKFVAGFIGSPSMNFIDGKVVGDKFSVASSDLTLSLPKGVEKCATYGVRPEHLVLDSDGLPVTIQVVEPMGSETQIIGHIANTEVTLLIRERIDVNPGDTINVSPIISQVHLFDELGERIN